MLALNGIFKFSAKKVTHFERGFYFHNVYLQFGGAVL